MGCLLSRQERSIGSKREVNTRERDQVSLELVQVDIKGSVEAKRCSDSRDNLGDDTIQIREAGLSDTKILFAYIVNSLIINLEGACVLQCCIYDKFVPLTMKEQSECSRVVWVVRTEL